MTDLPPLPPELTADAVESLPGRLARKLDDMLATARTWPVTRSSTGWEVKIDDQTLVRITHPPVDPTSLTCSCLLAPRCLHRAAVASLAPLAPEPATPPDPDPADGALATTPGITTTGSAPATAATPGDPSIPAMGSAPATAATGSDLGVTATDTTSAAAGSDHGITPTDTTTAAAGSDHGITPTDTTTAAAGSNLGITATPAAGRDLGIAATDTTNAAAGSDHGIAATDTTNAAAGSDHGIAATDTTNAAAGSDHGIAATDTTNAAAGSNHGITATDTISAAAGSNHGITATDTISAAAGSNHGITVAGGRPVPTDDEKSAAAALGRAAAEMLVTGLSGAGAVAQAGLLRAAHGARALRLPRASSAAIRVVEHLRAVHRDDPGFRLDDLVDDLRELLFTARGLGAGRPLHGTARREYRLVDHTRLAGIACEPVVTASGYAGAVAHLVDPAGRFFQVGAVLPGAVASAVLRADTPVTVGEARLTPRELGRAGLLGVDLRASADGRIGTGRDARAVRSAGHGWRSGPLAAVWAEPWPEQVRRYREALSLPVEERPAGHDLLFLNGTTAGYANGGVAFHTGDTMVTLIAPLDAPELPYVDNLRLLGRAPGLPMALLGRPAGRGRVAAIAFAADWLPETHPGHVDLGLDRLVRADLLLPGTPHPADAASRPQPTDPPGTPHPADPPRSTDPPGTPQPTDPSADNDPAGGDRSLNTHSVPAPGSTVPSPPLHLIARSVERAVEAGRIAVVARPDDVARLRSAAMPYAAELLATLENAARPVRDAFGRAGDGDTEAYAAAWLDAAVYLQAARLSADYG